MSTEQIVEPMTSSEQTQTGEENTTVSAGTNTERQQGRVKWFNNRAGYGFVTELDGDDIFVHHSGINVGTEQYKYLVQGEYVEFVKCESKNDKHPWQAMEICGIGGGKLMCETRFEQRPLRKEPEYQAHSKPTRGGRGPRDEGDVGWKLASK